jgi:hypothetical protein
MGTPVFWNVPVQAWKWWANIVSMNSRKGVALQFQGLGDKLASY